MGALDRIKSYFRGVRVGLGVATRHDKAPPRREGRAIFKVYREHPMLRLVVDTTADGVAAVQWRAYKRKAIGEPAAAGRKFRRDHALRSGSYAARLDRRRDLRDTGELEEAFDHAILALLADPNDYFPAATFYATVQRHLDLIGEAFLVVEKFNGSPVGLWAMPPTWVTALPSLDAPLASRVYEVTVGHTMRKIPADCVIHLRHADPEDPLARGVGLAFTLGDELDTDEYAARFTKTSFWNNMLPGSVISIKDMPAGAGASDAIARFKQSLAERHQGPENANRTLVTSGAVSAVRLDTTFKDMALVELRKHLAGFIRMTFRIPPEVVGDLSSSNKAAAYAAQEIFARQTIAPRLEFLRAYLQKFLVPMFSDGAELVLEYENPAPADEEFQLRVFAAQPSAFTYTEWRALGGKRPHSERDGFPALMPGQAENPQPASPGQGSEAEAIAEDGRKAAPADPLWASAPLK